LLLATTDNDSAAYLLQQRWERALPADLAGQLRLLAGGNQRPGAAAHADVLVGEALRERAGAGRARKQPKPGHH